MKHREFFKEKKELLKHIDAGNYNSAKNIIDNIKRLKAIKRIEEIRAEIKKESISYGELVELQTLKQFIESNDVELLQWADVEE